MCRVRSEKLSSKKSLSSRKVNFNFDKGTKSRTPNTLYILFKPKIETIKKRKFSQSSTIQQFILFLFQSERKHSKSSIKEEFKNGNYHLKESIQSVVSTCVFRVRTYMRISISLSRCLLLLLELNTNIMSYWALDGFKCLNQCRSYG